MVTNYGLDNFIPMFLIGLVAIAIGIIFRSYLWLFVVLIAFGTLLILFAFWFFRDPHRQVPEEARTNPALVVSPADGKVIEIVEDFEPNYFNSETVRVSIFLSPLDVHVNRIPMSGVIKYFKFVDGKKLVASVPDASEKNQQTIFGLENEYGKIVFKQIVGILARRLVWDKKIGDTVQVGQKFGMMKFGSRMDIHLPRNSKIRIEVGSKVIAGITILAELPPKI